VLSTTPDDPVGGINDELLCQDGVIYAFERVPSGLELGSVELSRWTRATPSRGPASRSSMSGAGRSRMTERGTTVGGAE